MKNISKVKGFVQNDKSGKKISNVKLVIFTTLKHNKIFNDNRITNSNGEFEFSVNLDEKPYLNRKEIFIGVVDKNNNIISTPIKVLTKSLNEENKIKINYDVNIANVKLSLLKENFFNVINDAISKAGNYDEGHFEYKIKRLFPPILQNEELLSLAHEVVLGNSEALLKYKLELEIFETWNMTCGNKSFPNLTKKQSEFLLSKEFIDSFTKNLPKTKKASHHINRIVSDNDVRTLRIAAIVAGGSDKMQIHKNLHIIERELSKIEYFQRLYLISEHILSGNKIYINSLNAELGFINTFPSTQIPGIDGVPSLNIPGIPGGKIFWPPIIDEPGLDDGPGFPDFEGMYGDGSVWDIECYAEILRATLKAFQMSYNIESIEPQAACPGDEIIIKGTKFIYEGIKRNVFFSTSNGGFVEVPPISIDEKEIKVIVPYSAVCGPIQLRLVGISTSFEVCGKTYSFGNILHPEYLFEGGEVHIDSFYLEGNNKCFNPGDSLNFNWSVCQANRLRIIIERAPGSYIIERINVNISNNSYVWTASLLGNPPVNTRYRARLLATSRCSGIGVDKEIFFSVKAGAYSAPFDPPYPKNGVFINWKKNIIKSLPIIPDKDDKDRVGSRLNEIVHFIKLAEFNKHRIGVQGSGWSFTDCVLGNNTNILFSTDSVATSITESLLPVFISNSLLNPLRSILSDDIVSKFNLYATHSKSINNRLAYIKGGTKIGTINCFLKRNNLALITMGGDFGQSIAGAINTSTHGGNPQLGPIANCVRAIHLLGSGGTQWWIEPNSNPITDKEEMERQKNYGHIDPCMKIVYDDELFYSVLVAGGSAGVVYAYVIEAVDEHFLQKQTIDTSWEDSKTTINQLIIDNTSFWFLEITVTPTRLARITTNEIIPGGLPSEIKVPDPWHDHFFEWLTTEIIPKTISVLLNTIVEKNLEIIKSIFAPWEVERIINEIELIIRTIDFLVSLSNLSSSTPEEKLELAIKFLNISWQFGPLGINILDEVQKLVLNGERPLGSKSGLNFTILTPQGYNYDDDTCNGNRSPHSIAEKLVESREYALPANRIIDFVDRILLLADEKRGSNDAIIVHLNIRFTQQTKALIGIQQFSPLTGHVEVYTFSGLAGNDDFHKWLDALVVEFNAIPHHGQLPNDSFDYAALFNKLGISNKISCWQSSMDRISRGGDSELNTFRKDFFIRRNLLREI